MPDWNGLTAFFLTERARIETPRIRGRPGCAKGIARSRAGAD